MQHDASNSHQQESSQPLTHFAKKSLGQNFLKSERALSDMVEVGDIQSGETIIEIGPGKGALTTKLLATIRELNNKSQISPADQDNQTRLVCIEKDDRLIPFLKEEYKKDIEDGVLEIIHGDIIEILNNKEQIGAIIGETSSREPETEHKPRPYKIIANIPYYITGLIFRGIFELEHLPNKIVMLVQKEVANRIMTYGDNGEQSGENVGKESILSISIKLYGTPRRVSIVPRGAFVPAPAVDSAIISVENIQRKIPKDQDARFFEMIHSAFSHKRKRLAKNLESFSGRVQTSKTADNQTSADYEKMLVELGLDKNVRAEEISIETYIQLFERLI
ncbi:MAG: rRNA (adenine1518-N6/adenine1519-N6)-dimethyltransferase [Patescibacteria group bacterium]|nr:rRNA (adenine1518-N6/adenine1519-N6)-dimethyltransferase [Patescibacteria group bacterium]